MKNEKKVDQGASEHSSDRAATGSPSAPLSSLRSEEPSPPQTLRDAATEPAHGLTVRMMKRYKCIHCGRGGYSFKHMKKHAERCTLNPDRLCGMCNLIRGGNGKEAIRPKLTIAEMVAMLPDPKQFEQHHTNEYGGEWATWEGLGTAVAGCFATLGPAIDNCPACTLAALRQAKIPVREVEAFNFKAECERVWEEFHEAEQANERY